MITKERKAFLRRQDWPNRVVTAIQENTPEALYFLKNDLHDYLDLVESHYPERHRVNTFQELVTNALDRLE